MDLSELNDRVLEAFVGDSKTRDRILSIVNEDISAFPFNKHELLISYLINSGGLDFDQYLEIRQEYHKRNPYLHVFEESPAIYGSGFVYAHLMGLCPSLQRASKEFDPNYNGEYDLLLDGIRIEVKSSRAVDNTHKTSLVTRALFRNTEKNFTMNFQQLKPDLCDIFIWVATFKDEVVVWVMSNMEVSNNPLFSRGQHRGNKGNEGQLHVKRRNIHKFNKFQLEDNNLEDAIRRAHSRG